MWPRTWWTAQRKARERQYRLSERERHRDLWIEYSKQSGGQLSILQPRPFEKAAAIDRNGAIQQGDMAGEPLGTLTPTFTRLTDGTVIHTGWDWF